VKIVEVGVVANPVRAVWQDGGLIVAVKPRRTVLRYFQTTDEFAHDDFAGAVSKAGGDETRTRNLRDRPVLLFPGAVPSATT
jgi:hypothetical protein